MEQTNELTIVEQIKLKINEIKDEIKREGVTSTVFSQLSKNAKTLQDKLNELLSKTILTQSDVNDAYETLQKIKREELERLSNRSKKNTIIFLAIGGLAIYGLYKLLKSE